MIKEKIKYFSLFTGIGGFDLPLRELNCECIGWSEIDKYAIKTFTANFPELKDLNYGDITKIKAKELPNFDLLVGGSPCQDLSISQGKARKGLDGERSGLFYDYVRILKEKQPVCFLWENVEGVMSCGRDWELIANSFISSGYEIKAETLNSADYGIPHYRKRIFVTGRRKDLGVFNFAFPRKQILKKSLLCVLEEENLKFNNIVINKPVRIGQIGNGGRGERVYSINGTSICLGANGGGGGAKTGLYEINGAIRTLLTLECFRLQGFPDEFHNKAKEAGISNCQLYKQAGNSVTVSVVRLLLTNLINGVENKQLCLF